MALPLMLLTIGSLVKHFNIVQVPLLRNDYLHTVHLSALVWFTIFLLHLLKNSLLAKRRLTMFERLSMLSVCLVMLNLPVTACEIYMLNYVNENLKIFSMKLSKGVPHVAISFIFLQIGIVVYLIEQTIVQAYQQAPFHKQ